VWRVNGAMPRAAAGRWCLAPRAAAAILAGFFSLSTAPAADFIVTSAGDGSDASPRDRACADAQGNCTLRAAIEQINALAERRSSIRFAEQFSAERVISLTSALPPVTQRTYITGLGRAACREARDERQKAFVTLDGVRAGHEVNGLEFADGSEGSVVEGMAIVGFSGHGVYIDDSGAELRCNYIGVTADGVTWRGNAYAGVMVRDGEHVVVGGDGPEERNIISGNGDGVLVDGSDNVTIRANHIGTDESGAHSVRGQYNGVIVIQTTNAVVGGPTRDHGNVISGNVFAGINVFDFSDTVVIRHNLVGLKADGAAPVPGTQIGVMINDMVPGGTISDNVIMWTGDQPGLLLIDLTAPTELRLAEILAAGPDAAGEIVGNIIGANAQGVGAVEVAAPAIELNSVLFSEIRGNLIVAPGAEAAVEINRERLAAQAVFEELGANGNVIRDNQIGVDAAGMDRSLGATGVLIRPGNNANRVTNNLIAAAGGVGVNLEGGENVVNGNEIGLAMAAVHPVNAGVLITAARNEVYANSIGHHSVGVQISGGRDNHVFANGIGVDVDGVAPRANIRAGVWLTDEARGNRIGGDRPQDFNAIRHNGGPGIATQGDSANNLLGNYYSANGGAPVDNGLDGADVNDACDADSGPNDRQNAPLLTHAGGGGVAGALQSRPDRDYVVEIYEAGECGVGGPGVIGDLLARIPLTSDIDAYNVFETKTSHGYANAAALALDEMSGATSEFSTCLAEGATVPPPSQPDCRAFGDLLDNATVLTFENEVVVGASAAALESPVRMVVSRADAHDVSFEEGPAIQRVSDYITITGDRPLSAVADEGFVVGFRVPQGKDAGQLDIWVLSRPGDVTDSPATEPYWRKVTTYQTAGAAIVGHSIAELGEGGVEILLAERTSVVLPFSGGDESAAPVDAFRSQEMDDWVTNQFDLDPRDLYDFRCISPDTCPQDYANLLVEAVYRAHYDFVEVEGFLSPRLGLPDITVEDGEPATYVDQHNTDIVMHFKAADGNCWGVRNAAGYYSPSERRFYMCYDPDALTDPVKWGRFADSTRHEYFHAIQSAYETAYLADLSFWTPQPGGEMPYDFVLEGTATLAVNSAQHAVFGDPGPDGPRLSSTSDDYVMRRDSRALRDSSVSLLRDGDLFEYKAQDFWHHLLKKPPKFEFNVLHQLFLADGQANGSFEDFFEATFGQPLSEAYYRYTKDRMYEGAHDFDGELSDSCVPFLAEGDGIADYQIREWRYQPMPGYRPRHTEQFTGSLEPYASVIYDISLEDNRIAPYDPPDFLDATVTVTGVGNAISYKIYRVADHPSQTCATLSDGLRTDYDDPDDHAVFSTGEDLFIIVSNNTTIHQTYRIDLGHRHGPE